MVIIKRRLFNSYLIGDLTSTLLNQVANGGQPRPTRRRLYKSTGHSQFGGPLNDRQPRTHGMLNRGQLVT